MRLLTGAMAGAGLMMATLMPAAVAAEAKIYPYSAGANFCPAGFQPITISGVICCGKPNQNMSYQQALAHPVAKPRKVVKRVKHVKHARVVERASCPVGTKGCTYD